MRPCRHGGIIFTCGISRLGSIASGIERVMLRGYLRQRKVATALAMRRAVGPIPALGSRAGVSPSPGPRAADAAHAGTRSKVFGIMPIRNAHPLRDAAACAAIYAPYVTDSVASFEALPPTP